MTAPTAPLPATSSGPPARRALIPDYELLKFLDRGSYGEVWLARGVTGLYRAVKIVWRDAFRDPRPYEREFNGLKEFAAISLGEPRQLALLHVGRTEDFFYYVMELADDVETGREIDPVRYEPCTLREIRARRGRLPATEVVRLGVELSRALATLHARSLVHRDIKPSNIVIVGGAPKLADIGLVASASAELTFVGTEGYVAPEGPGAPAADVYGVGKVLYELATGLDRRDYPSLPAELPEFPDRKELLELNAVIVRACEADVRRRHVDAAALHDELLLLQAGKSVRRLRAAERHLGRALRVAAVLGLVAALAAAGAWIEHRRAAKTEKERDALARRSTYIANLAEAQRALELEDYGRARNLLTRAKNESREQDLPGFEWHALWHAARGSSTSLLPTTGVPIEKMALSSDQKLLGVHDAQRTLVVYDLRSRNELRRIPNVHTFAGFSADGAWVLGSAQPAGANNATQSLQRWRIDSGNAMNVMQPEPRVRVLGVRGQAEIIAFREADSTTRQRPCVVVIDVAAEREMLTIPIGEDDAVLAWRFFRGAVSPDGNEVTVACVRGQGPDAFPIIHVRLSPTAEVSTDIAPARPGALGYLDDADGTAQWWLADTSRHESALFDRQNRRWARSDSVLLAGSAIVKVRGDHGEMFVAADESTLAVWPASDPPQTARRVHSHALPITSLLTLKQTSELLSASADGELHLWRPHELLLDRDARQCRDIHSSATSIVFSSDGTLLAVPEENDRVAILRAADLERVALIDQMRHPLLLLDDAVFGVAADGRAIVRWDKNAGKIAAEIGRSDEEIRQAAFSANGRWLCFTRRSGELCTIEMATGAMTIVRGNHGGRWPLVLSDDGGMLWSTSTRELHCLTLPEGRLKWSAPISRAIVSSLTRDRTRGRLIAAVEDGTIHVFDENTGRKLTQIVSGSRAVEAAAVLPSGSRLIAIDVNGDVHAMEPDGSILWGRLTTHARTKPYAYAFSPNSQAVAFLTVKGMLHIVRAD